MKKLNHLSLIGVFALLTIFSSCGKEDSTDPTQTEKDLVLEALKGSWLIDASASSFGNIGIDGSDVGVVFSETGFTLSGGISPYISGGTYLISETGAITEITLTIASTEIVSDGTPSISLNGDKNQATISFTTEQANGRVNGLGTYKIVINRN